MLLEFVVCFVFLLDDVILISIQFLLSFLSSLLHSMASVEKQLLGTETAQAMRAKGVDSILIGLSANDIRDSFLSSGANHFLLKPMPCKPDSLREALWKILQKADQ